MSVATAVTLQRGQHDRPEDGACLLELVSVLAGEDFTDAPRCVSPVLANAGRAWNDSLGDGERQRLLAYAEELVGSAGAPEDDVRRTWAALDWLVRRCLAGWLDAAGLDGPASALRSAAPVTGDRALDVVRPVVEEAAAAAEQLLQRAASQAPGQPGPGRRTGYLAAAATGRDLAAAAAWPGPAPEDAGRDEVRESSRRAVLRLAQAVAREARCDGEGGDDALAVLDAVAPALRPLHESAWELFDRLVRGPLPDAGV